MAFLKALNLRGFKTFSRSTELRFEPGVTVIIGPNGSGKSNLADAVLWALGEQSPGTLRGKAMQDVIFAGSDGHRPSHLAEVRLLFENSSGAFPGGFAEVEVTRRLSREGHSEYLVNGVPRRLLDVQELCAAVGLGREMHSIISQGRVEELLSSSSIARRALVEEAAGLALLKKRRERSTAKLERVGADLARVTDIEREVRNALRPLKQQVSTAERHLDLSERIAGLEALLLLREIARLEARQKLLVRDATTKIQERNQTEQALAELRRHRENEERGFTQALAAREAQGMALNVIQSGAHRLHERRQDILQRVARNEAELARLERREAVFAADFADVEERLQALGEPTGWSTGRLSIVRRQGDLVAAQLEQLRPRLANGRAEEDAQKDRIFDLEGRKSRDRQKIELLRREVGELRRRRAQMVEKVSATGDDVTRLQEEVADISARREAAAAAAEAAAASSRQAASAAHAARQVLSEAKASLRRAEEGCADLQGRLRIAQRAVERREGLPAAARDLLAGRSSACLLIEMLEVQAGFERAVSAILGPLAEAVVVQESVSASVLASTQGAIELVGLETLLPDGEGGGSAAGDTSGPRTVWADPDHRSTEAPDGVWALWDVVNVTEPLAGTLRALLPEAFIVDDLSHKTLLADSAMRVTGTLIATRAGELLRGGVHGARRVSAGPEALLLARRSVKELEIGAAEAERQVAQARTALVEGEKAVSETHRVREKEERNAKAARGLVAQTEEKLGSLQRRLVEISESAERLRMENDHLAAAENELTEEIEKLTESLKITDRGLSESRDGLRLERDRLQQLGVTVAYLEEKRAQAGVLEARLVERQKAHMAEVARVERDRARLRGQLKTLNERHRALTAALPVVRELLHVVEGLGEIVEERAVQAEAGMAASKETTAAFAEALRRMADRESELQRRHTDTGEALVELQVERARVEDDLKDSQERLEGLKQRHLSPRAITREEAEAVAVETATASLDQLRRRRAALGPVNPLADREYRETAERLSFLVEQRKDLEDSLTELGRIISDLDTHVAREFAEFFEETRRNFGEMVAVLFPGGKGELRLEEQPEPPQPEPPSAEYEGVVEEGEIGTRRKVAGVEVVIKLPQKAPRILTLLSGGEKALAAIAFLFALFLARPCPFYILDEVEAALDDINIGRFLSLVRRYQDRTQFIIITHQRRTMEIADTLYGVAMGGDGVSRVLSRRLTGGLSEEEQPAEEPVQQRRI